MNRIVCAMLLAASAMQTASPLPAGPLSFGGFTAVFEGDHTFALEGEGWPAFNGTWTVNADAIELLVPTAPAGCTGPGRYRFRVDAGRVTFDLTSDDCVPRRMILDRSTWRPAGEPRTIPVRNIERTIAARAPLRPKATIGGGDWPSFRGPNASGIAERQMLPDTWNVKTGEHVLWRTPIPGLAHSSPIVWGDRVFVTTAISTRPDATFRTWTLRRWRRLRRSLAPALGSVRHRQTDRQGCVGARRPRGRAAQQAPHQVDLRELQSGHRRSNRRCLVRVGRRVCLRPRRHAAVDGRSGPRGHGRVRHPDVRVGASELADYLE